MMSENRHGLKDNAAFNSMVKISKGNAHGSNMLTTNQMNSLRLNLECSHWCGNLR